MLSKCVLEAYRPRLGGLGIETSIRDMRVQQDRNVALPRVRLGATIISSLET